MEKIMRRWSGVPVLVVVAVLLWAVGSAHAQLVAVGDVYAVPMGQSLVVEAFGVLDNDTLDGQAAGENGAKAELVSTVSHGTLQCESNPAFSLCSDGSFTYTPGVGFTGSDTFTYRAVFAQAVSQATVTLTACSGGPQVFSCWQEGAYLAKLAELGYGTFQEGFEDDAAWGSVREPNTAPSVASQGITWTSNHPDPPASNGITTGSGAARTGLWGLYDPDHGYATGSVGECDINNPPAQCLFHDGFSGTRVAGESALHGVGGFLKGFTGANIVVILDGSPPIGFGKLPDPGYHFFGVIDTNGFTGFEFREIDGKVGQERLIFGDDFTFGTVAPPVAPVIIPSIQLLLLAN